MTGLSALLFAWAALGCTPTPPAQPTEYAAQRTDRLDALEALWSYYKFHYIDEGRVVSLDEKHITTSEGQGYAMLRAVWSDDDATFDQAWEWTKRRLRGRGDALFGWKWKGKLLDRHAATDADTDIALALIMASRRFAEPRYQEEALEILDDIWEQEIFVAGDACYATAGDWSLREKNPVLHVGYLAPYAYSEFAKVDSEHAWNCVEKTTYDVLRWLYFEKRVQLPPERIYVVRETGLLSLENPKGGPVGDFSYDVFPIFWRVALDANWHWRREEALLERMLEPLRGAYARDGRLYDRYTTDGSARSALEGLPLYATLHSLAEVVDPEFATRLREEKLDELWQKALVGKDTPYYLHNWLAFDELSSLGLARRFDEFLGFLRPFDVRAFTENFPKLPFAACLLLFPIARLTRGTRWHRPALIAFLIAAFAVCLQYLGWRGLHSLNFVEPLGPVISLALWMAELYCFGSVILLVVQLGLRESKTRPRPETPPGFAPSVDVMIPIFKEPLEILESTLIAAGAMHYPDVTIYVLDDGHREDVRELAQRHGAHYLRGPRIHAKAGNLNQALENTRGDLVVVFDTDHVPTRDFLEETVPFFHDADLGFVQTPHHFRNPDIFQQAFRLSGRLPNEQDMFNHGIQSRRDTWGGAFFVGSGAVFRRTALESVGGFKLLSITEDIHTSQHMHAAGWKSVYVNRDLAVGLAAENLASYLVQRRRWMLGCLQIFFRDNPLFCRGLSLRQRVGYFASLYHFFYPLPRIVFAVTPLFYLFFHLHPILSEVSVLTAMLIPYLIVLPMISAALLPNWSRPFWGNFYENAVSAPLARSIFDLLLPKSLGFQVTPKGIVSQTRRFDWQSTKWTVIFAGLTALAVVKGIAEFRYFGIERDAYFFNLAWSSYNLLFLVGALLLAWERPQRREHERIRYAAPARLFFSRDENDRDASIEAWTRDLGMGGCSLTLGDTLEVPDQLDVELDIEGGLRIPTRLVYHERIAGRSRVGLQFVHLAAETRRALLLGVFADSKSWAHAHDHEARGQLAAAASFLWAIAGYFRPLCPRRRHHPRSRLYRMAHLVQRGEPRRVWLRDVSPKGFGIVCFGRRPYIEGAWRITAVGSTATWGRTVYVRPWFFLFWHIGVEGLPEPRDAQAPEAELAA